jgi:tetratricopeptide (TPR) repeat protein
MYDSSLSEAYAALALAYFYKTSYDEALSAVNKALEIDPKNFFGHWILSRIYSAKDRDRDAIEPLLKVMELNPNFYLVYSDLRMIYERLNETEKFQKLNVKAIQFFSQFMESNPDDSRARILFANNLIIAHEIERAKQEIKVALTLSPDDNVMLYNAACAYARINEKELAIKTLRDIILGGYEDFDWIKRDPDFDNIRSEPEYIELMKGK